MPVAPTRLVVDEIGRGSNTGPDDPESDIRTMGGAWETLDHADGTSEVRPVQEGIVMVPLMTMYRRLAEDRFKPVAG